MMPFLVRLALLIPIISTSPIAFAQTAICKVTKEVTGRPVMVYEPTAKNLASVKPHNPILFINETLYTGGDSPEVTLSAYWSESAQRLELSICLLGINSCASTVVPANGNGQVTYDETNRQRLTLACEINL